MAVKHFAVALAALALAPAALAESFRVEINQTVALKIAAPAESVVVGNAAVADVAVHDPTTILITGKAFGTTNVLVLDKAGKTVFQNQIAVAGQGDGAITIVRGGQAPGIYTFSCVEKCRPTPIVGDAPAAFQEVMQSINGINAAAKGGAEH